MDVGVEPLRGGGEGGAGRRALGRLPVLEWLRGYRREWLRPDVVAGLTTAAVVIPKAMAYATIAGLPVEVGLYTAFLPMLLYALLGTSMPLSVSTSTTLAVLVVVQLDEVAPGGDAHTLMRASSTLTVLVGLILVAASLLRLGFVASFISEPILIGFKAGIGLTIVVDQAPKLLGIHIASGPFLRKLAALVRGVPHASILTTAVGAVMVAILVILEHQCPRVPAPLVAVALGIIAMCVFHLEDHGVEPIGKVPRGFPPLTLPEPSLFGELWAGALGVALMSFTETIAAGRAFADDEEPPPRPNQELLATGIANLGGALLGSMPAGGGTTQTAVNRLAGARSQLAALVTSAASLATMLLLSPVVSRMPEATLAAVVIVYSAGLIRPAEFRAVLQVRRMEFLWAVVAFLGVVLLGTLKGIVVAIIVSLMCLAYQLANAPVQVVARRPGASEFQPVPDSEQHPAEGSIPGLLLLRLEGRVCFANAERIAEQFRARVAEAQPQVVALDFSGVPDLEYTALKMLVKGERRQRDRGVRIWLAGLNARVSEVVRRSPLAEVLGEERTFASLDAVVDKYLEMTSREAGS